MINGNCTFPCDFNHPINPRLKIQKQNINPVWVGVCSLFCFFASFCKILWTSGFLRPHVFCFVFLARSGWPRSSSFSNRRRASHSGRPEGGSAHRADRRRARHRRHRGRARPPATAVEEESAKSWRDVRRFRPARPGLRGGLRASGGRLCEAVRRDSWRFSPLAVKPRTSCCSELWTETKTFPGCDAGRAASRSGNHVTRLTVLLLKKRKYIYIFF